jgi:hypothetical protein
MCILLFYFIHDSENFSTIGDTIQILAAGLMEKKEG